MKEGFRVLCPQSLKFRAIVGLNMVHTWGRGEDLSDHKGSIEVGMDLFFLVSRRPI